MFAPAPPRLAFVGHTHLPLLRDVPWGRVVNVGSVGAPLDDPRATYAVATRTAETADGDWAVTLVRLPYDVEAGLGAADPTFAALLARQLRTERRVLRDWFRARAVLDSADRPAALARILADES
jgi:diadenosine tetraphosphatase ApaH/serine/threonine PP2A family protein phosphatase